MENVIARPALESVRKDVRLSAKIQSFSYPDGTQALSNINIDVRRGEFAGILGANGSGKTTLLQIMDGLLRNYEGSVRLDGSDVAKLSPKEIYSKVGLIFQNPDDQLFAATVFEDASFGPINMGLSEPEVNARVRQALADTDLSACAGKSVHSLSFGQKRRACIAGLLAMGHEILLLDEPTAGLDPAGETRMMDLLLRLNKQKNVTIVMATHSIDLAPLFLDRIYVLNRGLVVRDGAPEAVFTAPDDMSDFKLRLPHVAELIYRLKHEDRLAFDRVPLTIGEARREINAVMAAYAKQGANCAG